MGIVTVLGSAAYGYEPALRALVAAGAAFDAVFGVFLAACVGLVVFTMRWAVRRDRSSRAAWLARRGDADPGKPMERPAVHAARREAAARRGRRDGLGRGNP